MSQDIVADGLNQMMNAKRSNKNSVTLTRYSKFFLSILAIGKLRGYISDYKSSEGKLVINFDLFNACKAIKPRYMVQARNLGKYIRRYLPARDMGILIISTSQGLMTHQTAQEKNLGGSVIAYFY